MKEIEDFYSFLEKNLKDYTRPKDYVERYQKTLEKRRSIVKNQSEGKTPWRHHEH